MGHVGDIVFLASSPGWFGNDFRISTAIDDSNYCLTKATTNLFTGGCTTLIFYSIMEQSRNRLVFVSPIFKDDTSHTEQVSDIGYCSSFACLFSMQLRCENECLFKTGREYHILPPSGYISFSLRNYNIPLQCFRG